MEKLGWGLGSAYSGASGSGDCAGCGSHHCPFALWAPVGAVVTLQESVVPRNWTLSHTVPAAAIRSLVLPCGSFLIEPRGPCLRTLWLQWISMSCIGPIASFFLALDV